MSIVAIVTIVATLVLTVMQLRLQWMQSTWQALDDQECEMQEKELQKQAILEPYKACPPNWRKNMNFCKEHRQLRIGRNFRASAFCKGLWTCPFSFLFSVCNFGNLRHLCYVVHDKDANLCQLHSEVDRIRRVQHCGERLQEACFGGTKLAWPCL